VGFEVGERVGFMPASDTCREYKVSPSLQKPFWGIESDCL
jgi:hypothetical protein